MKSAPAVRPRLERAMAALPSRAFPDHPLFGELLLSLWNGRDPDLLACATEQLEVAVRLTPGSASAPANHGVALASAGRSDEAAAAFLRALHIDPEDATMHFNLGALHERLGDHATATRWYSEAARLRPGWDPPRQRLAALARTAE
jgi:tetratricopeptide (TPR) repeat protein